MTIVPRCEQCAAPLSGRQGRTCSWACWLAVVRVPDAVCPACRLPFRRPRPHYRFCSVACSAVTRRAGAVTYQTWPCAQCGQGFTPTRRGSRFCGRRCASQYGGEHRVPLALTALLTCLWRGAGQPVEIEALARELYVYADYDELHAVRAGVCRLRRQLRHHRIETILRGSRPGAYRLVRLEATP